MTELGSTKYLIGMLLGVPLYQPLPGERFHRNTQDGRRIPKHLIWPAEFDDQMLVLGDGSGGHPAIVFADVDHCVARYLRWCLGLEAVEADATLKAGCANMQGDIQTIEYWNWTNKNHLVFRRRCSFFYSHFEGRMSFEGWLLASVGEFVFHVIPSFSPVINDWHKKYTDRARKEFKSILIPYPPILSPDRLRFRIIDTALEGDPDGTSSGR